MMERKKKSGKRNAAEAVGTRGMQVSCGESESKWRKPKKTKTARWVDMWVEGIEGIDGPVSPG